METVHKACNPFVHPTCYMSRVKIPLEIDHMLYEPSERDLVSELILFLFHPSQSYQISNPAWFCVSQTFKPPAIYVGFLSWGLDEIKKLFDLSLVGREINKERKQVYPDFHMLFHVIHTYIHFHDLHFSSSLRGRHKRKYVSAWANFTFFSNIVCNVTI